MTKQEFIKAAEGKVENDSTNVWVTIGNIQANIKIQAVLGGRQETEPFEASASLKEIPSIPHGMHYMRISWASSKNNPPSATDRRGQEGRTK